MRSLLFTCTFLLLSLFTFAQTAAFSFTIVGGTQEQIEAIEYAGDLWSQYLESEVDIEVRIVLGELGTGQFLGLTIPNGVKDFAAAPVQDVWYPVALANSLAGYDLKPDETDMDIIMNTSFNWYYGLDANPPGGQQDFVSVVLHEIGHGLGVASLSKVEGSNGSFGEITAADFAPLGASFPFPELNGKPGIFDLFLVNGNQELLTDEAIFPNPSGSLEDEFRGNDLFFDGPQAVNSNNGVNPRIYAPGTYSFGSSISHLDEDTYPNNSGNSLMTPFLSAGNAEHEPGPIALGILIDIGWNPNSTTTNEVAYSSSSILFPNPASEEVVIRSTKPNITPILWVHLYSIEGNLLQVDQQNPTAGADWIISVTDMPNGYYWVQVVYEDHIEALPLIVTH